MKYNILIILNVKHLYNIINKNNKYIIIKNMGDICDCNEKKSGLFICLICKNNQGMINGKEKVINGYSIEIILVMLLITGNLMILLKIVGKILEELLLINGMQLIGFALLAVILLKLFMIIFLIAREQKNIK